MIKIIAARYQGDFRVILEFSDGASGELDGRLLLQRSGPLLEPLHDESYFGRCFVDAGGLCWPNGLELSPSRLRESVRAFDPA
jgi:hypothetical protein